jgi:hypothetical protein
LERLCSAPFSSILIEIDSSDKSEYSKIAKLQKSVSEGHETPRSRFGLGLNQQAAYSLGGFRFWPWHFVAELAKNFGFPNEKYFPEILGEFRTTLSSCHSCRTPFHEKT